MLKYDAGACHLDWTISLPASMLCIKQIQAGLVLCQGYIPEKRWKNQNCTNL